MIGRPGPGYTATGAALPPGIQVAGIAPRLGAWLIDSLILGVGFVFMTGLADVLGAFRLNPEAQRQLEAAPLVLPSVPVYDADLVLVAVFAVALVAINAAYATFCVARWRGLPGQRMLSLEVADAATGKNLRWGPALVRSVISLGIPTAGLAGCIFGFIAMESSLPWSAVVDQQRSAAVEAWMASWGAPLFGAMLALFVWPVVLLIWTAASSDRQGLHDIASRAQVVVRAKATWVVGAAYMPGPMPPQWPGAMMPPGSPPQGGWPPPASGPYPTGYAGFDDAGRPIVTAAVPGLPTEPDHGEPEGRERPEHTPSDQMPWVHSWQRPELSTPAATDDIAETPAWVPSVDDDKPMKLRSATVGKRVAAYAIDSVVVYLIFQTIAGLIAATLLHPTTVGDSTTVRLDERSLILIGLMGGLLQVVYFVSSWLAWRGTLGQRLLHLVVQDATTGKALAPMDAFLRWAIMQGPVALVTIAPGGDSARALVMSAAMVWAFVLLYSTQNNPDWRGLHDRFVNSRVAQET
jgi:uncharacterized RDD family membrane protein YckC